jgi:hypothetical protein
LIALFHAPEDRIPLPQIPSRMVEKAFEPDGAHLPFEK